MIYRIFQRKLINYKQLPPLTKKLVFIVFILSFYQMILYMLGSKKKETAYLNIKLNIKGRANDKQLEKSRKIENAIKIAAKYIFWSNKCRHQSWQAIYLLNYHKIPFSYYVGLKRSTNNELLGHSWVMVNDQFICGNCDTSSYLVVNH